MASFGRAAFLSRARTAVTLRRYANASAVAVARAAVTPQLAAAKVLEFSRRGIYAGTRGQQRPLHTTALTSSSGGDRGGTPTTVDDEDLMPIEEIREKLASGKKLPLFCLDLVRYPGQQFPLYIFEPRYMCMFESLMGDSSSGSDSELQDGLFGLVCTRPADTLDESIGETDWRSYNVGTVVEVGGVSRIEEDRLLVICKARAAIQLKDEPERTLLGYWRGEAELCDAGIGSGAEPAAADGDEGELELEDPIPKEDLPFIEGADNEEDDAAADELAAALDPRIIIDDAVATLEAFAAFEGTPMNDIERADVLAKMERLQMAGDVHALSFWYAGRVPLISELKQELLEMNDPHIRLMKSAMWLKKIVKEYSPEE